LWLAIAGALLAAMGQELSRLDALKGWPAIAKGIGVLAATAVALSAWFAKEALAGNKTSQWVKARTAAESLKSLVYLYRAGVPPFDTADREKLLFDRAAAIQESVVNIQTRSVPPDADPADLSPLTVEGYIAQRVNDQIGYYDRQARICQKANDALHNIVLWLGAVSVLLGIIAAFGWVPGLIALLATLTASLSAHSQSQQYQTLIVTCQATSRRLLALKGEWIASHKTDTDTAERSGFISRCEAALALENGAWAGEWSGIKP
jgi:hypothetical protein